MPKKSDNRIRVVDSDLIRSWFLLMCRSHSPEVNRFTELRISTWVQRVADVIERCAAAKRAGSEVFSRVICISFYAPLWLELRGPIALTGRIPWR